MVIGAATALRLKLIGGLPRVARDRATLGWRPESRWDSQGAVAGGELARIGSGMVITSLHRPESSQPSGGGIMV